MTAVCLSAALVSLLIAAPLTRVLCVLGSRLGTLDGAGVSAQHKAAPRRVPNIGGVAIFVSFAFPLAAALAAVRLLPNDAFARISTDVLPHLPGIRTETTTALALLACLALIHVLGLIDDRKPLPAMPKLAAMSALATILVLSTDTRLLTALDPHVGGSWLSVLITVAWIIVITNAFNFLDNMDALSAGVALIATSCFCAAALLNHQWFVASALALLAGSLAGFLIHNLPPARIFMGDGGSLVVGMLLAFLTTRTTYYSPGASGGWYAVCMPLVVLAIPLYDFFSVTVLRVLQGKSPFVGDLQHFSHRLVRRGLSTRAAVAVICGLTAVTAISGISLASLEPWQAALVGVQTLLVLLVLAAYERASPNIAQVQGRPDPYPPKPDRYAGLATGRGPSDAAAPARGP